MKNNTTHKQILLMTVKNDVAGQALIKSVRETMAASNSTLRVILYGRGHRHGKGRMHVCKCVAGCGCRWYDNSFQSHLPLDKAEKIAVYVTGRGRPNWRIGLTTD